METQSKEVQFEIHNTVIINLQCTPKIKSIAKIAAIRKGMNLSAYIRNLIIQDNE